MRAPERKCWAPLWVGSVLGTSHIVCFSLPTTPGGSNLSLLPEVEVSFREAKDWLTVLKVEKHKLANSMHRTVLFSQIFCVHLCMYTQKIKPNEYTLVVVVNFWKMRLQVCLSKLWISAGFKVFMSEK